MDHRIERKLASRARDEIAHKTDYRNLEFVVGRSLCVRSDVAQCDEWLEERNDPEHLEIFWKRC